MSLDVVGHRLTVNKLWPGPAVSCESISSTKVQQKMKSPKNRVTSEVFRKFFGSFSENYGNSSAPYR